MPKAFQDHIVNMVDFPVAPTRPFHVRSVSIASRDHPHMLRVGEELQKIKSSVAPSSLTVHMICEGLRRLGGLYKCIDELLHLPSSSQLFSNLQQKKLADVELDGSVRLLDLLGIMRDCIITTKEQIRDHETALRRRREEVARAHIQSDKKAEKDIKNCFRLLKQMDDKHVLCCTDGKDTDQRMVIKTLKEARDITISLLKSIFNFLSMSWPKTKASRWSLISKALQKRRVACEREHEDIEANDGRVHKAQDQLQTLQSSIEDIEAGLECLFRRLIQNRVSLLNILSL